MSPLPTLIPLIEGEFTPAKGKLLLNDYVRAVLDQPGEHHIWIGPLDPVGGAVRVGQAGPLIDALSALARCLLPPLKRGYVYGSTCGFKDCCNLQHAASRGVLTALNPVTLRPLVPKAGPRPKRKVSGYEAALR